MIYRFCVRRRVLQSFLIASFWFGVYGSAAMAAEEDFEVGFCSSCSTGELDWAAMSAVTDATGPGTYPVYVLNVNNGDVHYFDVNVWWDCGSSQPQSKRPLRQAGTGYPELMQSNCMQMDAVPGLGSGTVRSAIQDARLAILDYQGLMAVSIDITDVPGADDIESAIQLIGPGSAEFDRNRLVNSLNNRVDTFWYQAVANLSSLAHSLSNKLFENSIFAVDKPFYVEFPDGTRVRIRIESYYTTVTSLELVLEIELNTIQGPGLSAVPSSAGAFDGFSYGGAPDIGWELLQLADRIAPQVTCDWSCPSENVCELSCSASGMP